MKIISNYTKPMKTVCYKGTLFSVSEDSRWIATDEFGAIRVHIGEESPRVGWKIWERGIEAESYKIGYADLQDTDWEDTLVKV